LKVTKYSLDKMGLIEYIPWKFWITLMIILLVVMWAFWGGRRDYEIIGLRDTPMFHSQDNPVHDYIHTSSPQIHTQYMDSHSSSPRQSSTYNPIRSSEMRRRVRSRRSSYYSSDYDRMLRTANIDSNSHPYNDTTLPAYSTNPGTPYIEQIADAGVQTPVQHIGAFNVTQLAAQSVNLSRKTSVGEEITVQAFESLIGRKVATQIRPLFLKNPETGRPLELDCYDSISRIAVEYSGRQHYEFPSAFCSSEQDFYDQVYRDQLKRRLCDQNNIYLITVPYTIDMCEENTPNNGDVKCVMSVSRQIRYQRIRKYLEERLNELKLE
jgi:hypothetical protein